MTKEELLAKLRQCRDGDPEDGHLEADDALLDYINDAEVTAAFKAIHKWYA